MAAPKDKLVFSSRLLSLDKADVEMVAHLSLNGGRFEGTLSELCRALGRSNGTRARNGRQQSIDRLCALGMITHKQETARKIEITLTPPKENEETVSIERQHLENIMRRQYERSVAWQQVLKVYLWFRANENRVIEFKRDQIAAALDVSTSTITEATSVLKDHYGAIAARRVVYVDDDGNLRCCGQVAQLSAFWSDN